MLTASTRVNFK